jgi:hypothetical protein
MPLGRCWRKGINYSHIPLIERIFGGDAMTKMWTGDSAYGGNFLIEFKHDGDKQIVEVSELTEQRQKGTPVENRNLPLTQQDAESLVEQYLSELDPEEKELVRERLCTGAEAFSDPEPAL